MTPTGRTIWQAQDSAWWRRERIVLLGEQFGSEGPAVANWLECEAKAQNDGGIVKAGLTTAARGAFIEGGAERAREIVEFAVEIGFLKDYEPGARTFTALISAYADDQPAGRAAIRKADQRASESGTSVVKGETTPLSRSVPAGHGPSLAVAGGHEESRPSTREERRGEGEETTSSLRSDGARDDDWPGRLDPSLHVVAVAAHERLEALAAARGGDAPSRRRLGEIVADFPDHDHRAVAGDVFDYWVHGKGRTTVRKDWARVYRDRCKNVTPGNVTASIAGRRPPSNHVAGPSGLEGEIRQWERWCAENGVTHPHGPQVAWRLSRHGDKIVTVEKVTAMLPRLTTAEEANAA